MPVRACRGLGSLRPRSTVVGYLDDPHCAEGTVEGLWEELGHKASRKIYPVTLAHAGRLRYWCPPTTKGRPSYKGLQSFMDCQLSVGQELCLQGATEEVLLRHVAAAKDVAKLLNLTLEWDDSEVTTLSVERNTNVTARHPWVTRRVVVHRAFALLRARVMPLLAAEGTRLY